MLQHSVWPSHSLSSVQVFSHHCALWPHSSPSFPMWTTFFSVLECSHMILPVKCIKFSLVLKLNKKDYMKTQPATFTANRPLLDLKAEFLTTSLKDVQELFILFYHFLLLHCASKWARYVLFLSTSYVASSPEFILSEISSNSFTLMVRFRVQYKMATR